MSLSQDLFSNVCNVCSLDNSRCVVQVVVNGDKNSVVLSYLNSLTEYEIAVFAIYSNRASEALRGSETTCESSDLMLFT